MNSDTTGCRFLDAVNSLAAPHKIRIALKRNHITLAATRHSLAPNYVRRISTGR
jgi:hypothetical protein